MTKAYPSNRKRAKRPKDSYKAKSPEARERQLANLQQGRSASRSPRFVNSKGVISYENLQRMNIVQFAEIALGMDFTERPAQKMILKMAHGLELTPREREIYLELAEDEAMPDGKVFGEGVDKREICLVLGARAGKSTVSSILATYAGTRECWRPFLQPNEAAYVQLYATRELQSRAIIGQGCLNLLRNSRISYLIDESKGTSNAIYLTNNVVIQSFPANSTSGRGLPTVLLCADEFAFFSTVGPKCAEGIVNAIVPRLAQFDKAEHTPKACYIGTPMAAFGPHYDKYAEGCRVDGRLTLRASTRQVNPCISEEFIARERERDEASTEREFDAIFCQQVDNFFEQGEIDNCFLLTGDSSFDSSYSYFMSLDQAGGGQDFFACTICHRHKDKIIVDVLREWDSKDLDRIFREIGVLARQYSILTASHDRYASGYVSNKIEALGITAELRPLLPVCYVNCKRLVKAGLLELPVNKSLRTGLLRTQAYYGSGGSLSIKHERLAGHGHSDLCDSTVGSIWAASNKGEGGYMSESLRKMDEREQLRKAM
ncbi:MAG: hypothetical protein ABIF19_15185 [Planctomycetota bacterium]